MWQPSSDGVIGFLFYKHVQTLYREFVSALIIFFAVFSINPEG